MNTNTFDKKAKITELVLNLLGTVVTVIAIVISINQFYTFEN